MSPSGKDRRRRAKRVARPASASNGARGTPSKDWALAMYQTAGGEVPARTFLLECARSARLQLLAILVAVRDAPPPSFPTSNMWHAMKDEMKGFHEARDEHGGNLYRVFCTVDRQAPEHGLDAPTLAIISGGVKKVGTKMDQTVYDQALAYRDDYRATRRILLPPGVPASLMKNA